MDFEKYDTFIFDLDGTVWYWTKLAPGAKEIIERLKELNKEVLFITNNTINSRKGLTKRLNRFGIPAKTEDLVNAGYAIGCYLKNKNASAIAFGSGLLKDFRYVGVDVKKKPPVDYVVVGEDWKFNYRKLSLAKEAIDRGAGLLTSIIGRAWIVGDKRVPGVGCWVRAIEFATNTKAECLGKPSGHMVNIVREWIKSPEKTVLIGDELKSDVLFAKKLGVYSILVRTGADKRVGRKIKADLVVDSLRDIFK